MVISQPPRLDVCNDLDVTAVRQQITAGLVVGLRVCYRNWHTAVGVQLQAVTAVEWGIFMQDDAPPPPAPVPRSTIFTVADIERLSAKHQETTVHIATLQEAGHQAIGEGLQRVIECDGRIQLRRDWETRSKP
jgi:hypothetical protein